MGEELEKIVLTPGSFETLGLDAQLGRLLRSQ